MLDGIDRWRESGGDIILNDSDTEFVSDKPINDRHDVLVPEAKVHVTSELKEPQQKDCEMLRKKRKC